MTPEECIEFLARVEGSLTFRRDGDKTILTIAARGCEISRGYDDKEQAAALFNVPVHHVTTACKKLDNQIGG